jgi:hypothetical protein
MKTGARLRSQVDATEVVVVRPGADEAELTCGGHPMIDQKAEPGAGLAPVEGQTEGTQLGKRYSDGTAEILVTKAGAGTLALNGVPLELKGAKPLPASD